MLVPTSTNIKKKNLGFNSLLTSCWCKIVTKLVFSESISEVKDWTYQKLFKSPRYKLMRLQQVKKLSYLINRRSYLIQLHPFIYMSVWVHKYYIKS